MAVLHAQAYYRNWKIKMNESKTQAIIFPFNKSPKRNASISLSVDGVQIPLLDTIKYLGIVLDKKLTFKQQVLQSCKKQLNMEELYFPY